MVRMDHTITHVLDGDRGAFVIDVRGRRLATMTYSLAGDDVIVIDHTEVDPSLRRAGVGRSLVAAAVTWARDSDRRIMPLCSFVRSVLDTTPEYGDVRA
jgi:uncharacterized protein